MVTTTFDDDPSSSVAELRLGPLASWRCNQLADFSAQLASERAARRRPTRLRVQSNRSDPIALLIGLSWMERSVMLIAVDGSRGLVVSAALALH